MCRINEEMCNEARMEGEKEKSVKIAQQLISMGMSTKDISKATELSIEEVQDLADKTKAD